MVERVAQEVHVAALPVRFGQGLHDRAFKAGVIVTDRQAHAMQTAFLQAHEMVFPTAGALAVGQLDGEHVTAAVPADAERDQDRAAVTDAVFAHAFVPGIEDQIGILLLEPAGMKRVSSSSSFLLMSLTAEVLNSCPQSSSVIAFTRWVDTPCTCISIRAATRAFSLR